MMPANTRSGQAVPVPNTQAAAASAARVPIASLRDQIQAERMFASPVRDRDSNQQKWTGDALLGTTAEAIGRAGKSSHAHRESRGFAIDSSVGAPPAVASFGGRPGRARPSGRMPVRAESIGKLALKRIQPEQNMRRFYRMEVVTDLFGTILLQRRWGRIGTDGRLRCDPYPDIAAALSALTMLAERKRRRGYVQLPLTVGGVRTTALR
jgi:predicted DNA-binding WGR domain protein